MKINITTTSNVNKNKQYINSNNVYNLDKSKSTINLDVSDFDYGTIDYNKVVNEVIKNISLINKDINFYISTIDNEIGTAHAWI